MNGQQKLMPTESKVKGGWSLNTHHPPKSSSCSGLCTDLFCI